MMTHLKLSFMKEKQEEEEETSGQYMAREI